MEANESYRDPRGNLLMQLRVEKTKVTKLAWALEQASRERDGWKARALETEAENGTLGAMLRKCRC